MRADNMALGRPSSQASEHLRAVPTPASREIRNGCFDSSIRKSEQPNQGLFVGERFDAIIHAHGRSCEDHEPALYRRSTSSLLDNFGRIDNGREGDVGLLSKRNGRMELIVEHRAKRTGGRSPFHSNVASSPFGTAGLERRHAAGTLMHPLAQTL